jgi:hypothetical protein
MDWRKFLPGKSGPLSVPEDDHHMNQLTASAYERCVGQREAHISSGSVHSETADKTSKPTENQTNTSLPFGSF